MSAFSFPLFYNMHLFDDYDDTSSHKFRQLYPLRNHCSLIFIFAIIDSNGLTNNCLDFFFTLCCCTENQPWDEQKEMSVPKNGFSDIKQAAGFPFPSRTLELISTLAEGIFNMSAPCEAALPCWSLAHTCASSALSLSSGSSCGALRLWLTGGQVHRTPLLLSSLPRQRGGGLCPGGLADSSCFVCPIVN